MMKNESSGQVRTGWTDERMNGDCDSDWRSQKNKWKEENRFLFIFTWGSSLGLPCIGWRIILVINSAAFLRDYWHFNGRPYPLHVDVLRIGILIKHLKCKLSQLKTSRWRRKIFDSFCIYPWILNEMLYLWQARTSKKFEKRRNSGIISVQKV